jgi:RNA-directed DNA polymerase
VLTKPSKQSIKSTKQKIKEVATMLYGQNVETFIVKINAIVIGVANYWKSGTSKEIFQQIDHYIWQVLYKFIRRLHPKKSWKWIKARYFKPDQTGQSRSRWILTDPVSNRQLIKMAHTPIERHILIKGTASPYNKELKNYFTKRNIKEFDRNNVAYRRKLAKRQNYKCPLCGQSVTDFRERLETHHKIPKVKGGGNEYSNLQLVHASCHTKHHKHFPAKGPIPTTKQLAAAKKHLYTPQVTGLGLTKTQ